MQADRGFIRNGANMRSKAFPLILSITLLLGLLHSACSSDQQIFPSVSGYTPTSAETIFTTTPAFSSPTSTPLPPTQTTTATPSQMPSPSPTLTATSLPTLTVNESKEIIMELFKTNGNCTPPCFWGIVLGKTTLTEVNQFFRQLRLGDMIEMDHNGEVYHYATSAHTKDGYLITSIQLDVEQGIVKRIQVTLDGFDEPGVEPADWEAYNLKSILKTYGVPTRVVFSVDYPHEVGMPEGKVLYSYWLYFKEPNVMVFYPGKSIGDASYFQVCPISLKEEPSGMYIIFGEDPAPTFESWVDLTDASSLTYEDFYHKFTAGDENTCIALKREPFLEKQWNQ
jgi:hypothetical protein